MRLFVALLALFLLLTPAHAQNWQLIWADEFNGARNSAPDSSKWGYDIGKTGWGNNELENYTNSTDNAFLDGSGNLVIRAIATGNPLAPYSSARLKTQGKFSFTYGKIEARMKLPFGQGIWPAFWMLGENISTVGWPTCGEIDIMENIGKVSEQSIVYATIHGPNYSGSQGIGKLYTLPNGQKFSDAFHTFSAIWTPDYIEFFVDGNSYHKVLAETITLAGKTWVFNKPFFILLNLAVGGNWPKSPDSTTQFPQDYTIDYVRVWRDAGSNSTVAGVTNAASFDTAMSPGSLATVWGAGMAEGSADALFDPAQNAFRTSAAGAEVKVNGVAAPLTYASPGQINFQVPWETPTGKDVLVQVTRSGTPIDAVPVTFVPAGPSAFLADYQTGVAILTCPNTPPRPNDACTLWGNGFGAKKTAQQNGVPAPLLAIENENACTLTFGDTNPVVADVKYCGVAPMLVIDQLNFIYPQGIPGSGDTVVATLTVAGISGRLLLPAAR